MFRSLVHLRWLKGTARVHSQAAAGRSFYPLTPIETAPSTRSKLRGKQFLPGADEQTFPESLGAPTSSFPHAVQADGLEKFSISEWAQACREYIGKNLYRHGAILFRNLPLCTVGNFADLAKGLGYKSIAYEALAVLRDTENEEANIYTSNEEPPEVVIEPHNEMAYAPIVPSKLFFYCQLAPGDGHGGETPLIKGSDILSNLDAKVVRAFEARNVRYVRYAASKKADSYLPWQDTFGTDNKQTVESYLERNGYQYEWDESSNLMYWQTLPPISRHPQTGERIWFNQIQSHHASALKAKPAFKESPVPEHQYPYQTYYEDGMAIEPAVLQHIREVTWACAVGFQWRSGDVLVVDNFTVQHARMDYSGERKLLVRLCS